MQIALGKKIILSTGREVDLSIEQRSEQIYISATLNHHDYIHEIVKPMSIILQWSSSDDHNPLLSIECRGGSPHNRPISESEQCIEGLNGLDQTLSLNEFQELLMKLTEIKSLQYS